MRMAERYMKLYVFHFESQYAKGYGRGSDMIL